MEILHLENERSNTRRQLGIAAGVLLIGISLLTQAQAAAQGIRNGLSISAGVLIPALFPFMVFSSFLSLTKYGRLLSAPLRFLTTKIFKLPAELGSVVLLSMVGGYPVGAKMISGLLERKCIDRATASRMLCFCVNSGPSFLITAVGLGMFGSKEVGVLLLVTQTLATLLIGWVVSWHADKPSSSNIRQGEKQGTTALVMSVSTATQSMLIMCAFAILFSALLSVLDAVGLYDGISQLFRVDRAFVVAVVSGILEVTSGCNAAALVGGTTGLVLVCVFLSICSLSILFQIFSCFQRESIRFKGLLLSRVAHSILSTVMAVPVYRSMHPSQAVWKSSAPPLAGGDGKTILLSVCLLGMCSIFLLSSLFKLEKFDN